MLRIQLLLVNYGQIKQMQFKNLNNKLTALKKKEKKTNKKSVKKSF